MNELQKALERPFEPRLIHWRVGATTKDKAKCIPLAYIDARDVMRRLDEACGFKGWQCRYPHVSGPVICELGVAVSSDTWLWRSNGAGDTQVEADKGACSDAFKRAAVMWGIGRYLYNLPNTWVELGQYNKFTPPALPAWATPEGWDAIMKKREAA